MNATNMNTPDLDDPRALQTADVESLLPSAALGGAWLRASSNAIEEGLLNPIRYAQLPRSIIIVARSSGAKAAAELIQAITEVSDVPVNVCEQLPVWSGPLDTVLLLADDPNDSQALRTIDLADRFGTTLIGSIPSVGPAHDLMSSTRDALILPEMYTLNQVGIFSFHKHIANILAVLSVMEASTLSSHIPSLVELAETLDAEALADHCERESTDNPAKQLAEQMGRGYACWVGDSPATTVLALYASTQSACIAAKYTIALTLKQRLLMHKATVRRSPSIQKNSIFYDPDFDSPEDQPERALLLTVSARRVYSSALLEAIGDVRSVVAEVGGRYRPYLPEERDLSYLAELLALAMRIDLAAVYAYLSA